MPAAGLAGNVHQAGSYHPRYRSRGAALSSGTFALPVGLRLAQRIILVILSLGPVAAIFDRLARREIVAKVFVLLNNLGHWGMLIALATAPGPAG